MQDYDANFSIVNKLANCNLKLRKSLKITIQKRSFLSIVMLTPTKN